MRILSHRGSPGTTIVENTIDAISAALDAGADGAEVDLRLSADGVLVLCHDPDLSRLTGHALAVAGTPWQVLRTAADARGVRLARVEWLLAAAAGSSVVLELKAPPPVPGARARTAGALAATLQALRGAGLPMDVTVSSFDAALVRAFRGAATGLVTGREPVRTALLGRPGRRPSTLLRQALAAGHDQVHPYVLDVLAHPRSVAAAHACGLAVVPWTVNHPRAVSRCADLGVDAVITDVPVVARGALSARRAAA